MNQSKMLRSCTEDESRNANYLAYIMELTPDEKRELLALWKERTLRISAEG